MFEVIESNEKVERIRFNGAVYRRYPGAKGLSDRTYFRPSHADKQRGCSFLHRDVWIAHNGPIPDGWEVHHRDKNPLNNDPSNLEATPRDEHARDHRTDNRERGARYWASLGPDILRQRAEAAAAWHRSPEGRAWHSQHAKQISANMAMADCVCENCGAGYQTKVAYVKRSRACSNNCKSALRRKSGKDLETRVCPCGQGFTVNRYLPQRTCSRACSNRYTPRGFVAGLQPDR